MLPSLENRPRAHRGAPTAAVVMVVMVMMVRLRGLRRVQQRRCRLQVRGGARGLVVPGVVAQESRRRAAGAGTRAARAAAAAAWAAAAPHPWRGAEVPVSGRRDGWRSARGRGASPGVLLRGDLPAFPHLLELGSAVLKPDFDLRGKGTQVLVEAPGSGQGGGVESVQLEVGTKSPRRQGPLSRTRAMASEAPGFWLAHVCVCVCVKSQQTRGPPLCAR